MNTILWDALDAVRDGTMIKGRLSDSTGGHCALGFINKACWQPTVRGVVFDSMADIQILASVAAELFPDRVDYKKDVFNTWESADRDPAKIPTAQVAAFNNHPATTKADLELVFEKAAIKADEVL